MAANRESQSMARFPLFPFLPPELRIQIWNESFFPRVAELHVEGFMVDSYEDWNLEDRLCVPPLEEELEWVSNSSNPAALYVCSESRTLALRHYWFSLPVLWGKRKEQVPRILYFDLQADLLVILGKMTIFQLSPLLELFRTRDPLGRGPRRLGMSMGCWFAQYRPYYHKNYFLTLLEEFVLFMYEEQRPPAYFRDGECALEAVEDMDAFSRLISEHLEKVHGLNNWRIVNLQFIPGPVSIRRIIGGDTVVG
ncbi:hypothetical protein K449DRAFT_430407 [Hypoxylon sp. EC38]|nr:hypothetical protein K449DRAFT_430407 [Hypoxylon sp. EC38]